ncbi:MepB family protein [uncultured Formosa sp.]|uniref:MepB family protein n=1 Tax=uncultured Formosa sp. TaxID=255435 RepID=UPI00261EE805|nr:MepB family protein [uncultured Formosa sp.]
MNNCIKHIQNQVYNDLGLSISDYNTDVESKAYSACQFRLNGRNIISRHAKITPKKVGQFVTFWKRNKNGITVPFNESDTIDFFTVSVSYGAYFGQFVFPKSVLIAQGILSTKDRDGKRAFRVYPEWDVPQSKQAIKTQQWQLDFFYQIHDETDYKSASDLYTI